MTGQCIISFDCESKWGLMDSLNDTHDQIFSSQNINQAYIDILSILKHFDLPATFAFVGAFTMSETHFRKKWLEKLRESREHNHWLEPLYRDLGSANAQEWFAPELVQLVLEHNQRKHEVCPHGFTHLAWNNPSPQALRLELEGIADWYALHNILPSTFIFPRNIIANKDLLLNLDILGFRDNNMNPKASMFKNRIMQFIEEFNWNVKSAAMPQNQELPIPIPGAFFLNWRHGLRNSIPAHWTIRRFEVALNDARDRGGVVNLWTHPHNFITGHNQKDLFNCCMELLAEKSQRGEIEVLTQHQYIKKMPRAIASKGSA
jgi:peptidoglycan/xylan/chitin deacetylase (PgdA/CDA1 family)